MEFKLRPLASSHDIKYTEPNLYLRVFKLLIQFPQMLGQLKTIYLFVCKPVYFVFYSPMNNFSVIL